MKNTYLITVTNTQSGSITNGGELQTTRLEDVTEDQLNWFEKGVASAYPIHCTVTHIKI